MIKTPQNNSKRVISIIAGGGELPLRIIEKLKTLGTEYYVVSLLGFGPKEYPQFRLGDIGKILDFIKSKHTTEIMFCGNVRRPSLFSLRLDSLGRNWVKRLGIKAFLGDNSLLKGIKDILHEEGLCVISPQSVLGTLLTPRGILTKIMPRDLDLQDIARGIFVLNAMSRADIGQAVVVQEGVVIGVEAAEGTAQLIERCKNLKLTEKKGGVLVKTSKINQEQSIDLPTIGKNTVLEAWKANLAGIAIGAQKSQIIGFTETIELANEKGIFVIGL